MLKVIWKYMYLHIIGTQETSVPFSFTVLSETLLDPIRPACPATPIPVSRSSYVNLSLLKSSIKAAIKCHLLCDLPQPSSHKGPVRHSSQSHWIFATGLLGHTPISLARKSAPWEHWLCQVYLSRCTARAKTQEWAWLWCVKGTISAWLWVIVWVRSSTKLGSLGASRHLSQFLFPTWA